MPRSTAHKVEPAALIEAPDPTETAAAYEKYSPAAGELRPAELVAPNANLTLAATIATAGVQNVLDHRAELDAIAKKVPWSVIERVPEVALAAQHADMLLHLQEDETAAFSDVYPELIKQRGILLEDLDLLVRRELVEPKVPAELRKGNGTVRDFANDLREAVHYYGTHWDEVSPRTTMTHDELAAADALATKVLARLGAMQVAQTPKPGEPSASEMRRRMFTLLEQDYDVVRRYGAFVLWDLPGGWEAYVPALRSGRAKTGGAAAATEPTAPPTEPTTTTTTPSDPTVLPGNKPGFKPG